MEKAEIGRRIRAVRQRLRLSLRQVAAASQLSATHISEIERGHTFPTIGSLQRISEALGCEVHVFLEERWLPEVSCVRSAEAPTLPRDDESEPQVELLSEGIPGGKLAACRLRFRTRHAEPYVPSLGGEISGFVTSGSVTLLAGDGRHELSAGDGYHVPTGESHALLHEGSGETTVVVVATSD